LFGLGWPRRVRGGRDKGDKGPNKKRLIGGAPKKTEKMVSSSKIGSASAPYPHSKGRPVRFTIYGNV